MGIKYKLIAHRGFHDAMIWENSYLAITRGLRSSFVAGVEIDIRLTKDDQVVVIHDSNISRVSDGNLFVEASTLKELQKYHYGNKNFSSSICTLDKILDLRPNKLLVIEIKCFRNEKRFAKVLMNILNNYLDLPIYLISFHKKILFYLKKLPYLKGRITLKRISYMEDILVTHYSNYKRISKKERKIFLYTFREYKDILKIGDSSIYYICDNLNDIILRL